MWSSFSLGALLSSNLREIQRECGFFVLIWHEYMQVKINMELNNDWYSVSL